MNLIKLIVISEGRYSIVLNDSKIKLDVSIDSENWNTKGINTFLLEVVISLNDNEKLELDFNEDSIKTDGTYSALYDLFKAFIDEYNKSVNGENKTP